MLSNTQSTGTENFHQRATLEPVYRRVDIMNQFSYSTRRAHDVVADQFAKMRAPFDLNEGVPVDRARFHLVRRIWLTTNHDNVAFRPSFSYAYFKKDSFEPTEANAIQERLFNEGATKAEFKAYIAYWRDLTRPLNTTVQRALDWLTSEDARQPNSAELLHHYLLMMYSRTPVVGGIQDTLLLHAKGDDPAANLPGDMPPFYVQTLNQESVGGQGLPKLRLVPLRAPLELIEKDQLSISSRLADNPLANSFFLDRLDQWFRNGPTALAEGFKDRINLHMLWIPVFDFYSWGGKPAGMFVGWIFQFLGGQNPSMLEEKHLAALKDYSENCCAALPLLSDRLYDQAMREMAAQEVMNDPLRTLCDSLHLLEGWKKPKVVDDRSPMEPGRVVRSDGKGMVVSLRVTRFDNPSLWGAPYSSSASLALRLRPHDGEYLEPAADQRNKYQDRVAARIREVYRQFRLTDLRVRKAAEVEAQTTRADLAATFAHSFSKVGEAIKNGLDGSRADNILKTVVQSINEAPIPSDVRGHIQEVLGKARISARNLPATRLYRDYFYPQVRLFYDKVQAMERLHGKRLQPRADRAFSVKSELIDLFEKTVVPVAAYLPREGIRDTIQLFGRPEEILVTSGLDGLLLFPGSIENNPDSSGRIEDLLRDLWRNVFFELFLNALKGNPWRVQPRPLVARIRVSWEPLGRGVARIEITNPVDPPDSPVGIWTEDPIKRPSAEHGLSGWGRFGVRLTLEDILQAGSITFWRMKGEDGLGYGKCHIDIDEPWWGRH